MPGWRVSVNREYVSRVTQHRSERHGIGDAEFLGMNSSLDRSINMVFGRATVEVVVHNRPGLLAHNVLEPVGIGDLVWYRCEVYHCCWGTRAQGWFVDHVYGSGITGSTVYHPDNIRNFTQTEPS